MYSSCSGTPPSPPSIAIAIKACVVGVSLNLRKNVYFKLLFSFFFKIFTSVSCFHFFVVFYVNKLLVYLFVYRLTLI